MKIIILSCGFDNYSYLIICEETGAAAVVDPTEAYPVWREAGAAGAHLQAVLCTHHHHDHIGGLVDLLEEQPELKVYGHESDSGRIKGMNNPLKHGYTLAVGKLQGRVLHTPGHTDGSICYGFGEHLFTGDTLFGAGCGRLFEGSPEQMYDSLTHKIGALPDATRLYFGHEYTEKNLLFAHRFEPANAAIAERLAALREQKAVGHPSTPSTLGLEKATNPFLRCDSSELRRHLLQKNAVVDEVEVFTMLRRSRDSF